MSRRLHKGFDDQYYSNDYGSSFGSRIAPRLFLGVVILVIWGVVEGIKHFLH
jgi:hypothetical protein